jgi:diguanylate cyclase (GGDEF)-like protein/PAS domain S-box-containing protein
VVAPELPGLAELLAAVAQESPDLVATFAPISWQMRWANPALREWLQVPEWASPPLVELLDERSQGHWVVKVLPELLSQGWWHGVLNLVGLDVEPVTTTASVVAHRRPTGEIAGVVLSAQPTEATKARPPAQNHAQNHDEQFGALVEHVSDLIAVVEPGGTIRYASPAAATMLGYPADDLTGRRLVGLLHPDDRVDDVAALVRLDDDGNGEPVHLRLKARDGSWRFIEAVVSDLTANTAIGGFVLNARDVSERVRAQEVLTELAYRDPDTGLPNRLRLLDRVATHLEDILGDPESGGLAVALIDLDGFRQVNEAHGMDIANELVQQVGLRLGDSAGTDAMVARLRSDEFAVALPGVADSGIALRVADALRVALSQPFEIAGRVVRVTASVGVALAVPDDEAEALLTRADHATRLAKRGGGNRTELWDDEAAEGETRRLEVQNQLRTVVEQEMLRVHYQPIVSLIDDSLTGTEALLRVSDDVGHVLNPADLVNAAESAGLISRLGGQLLNLTCKQLSLWDAQLRTAAPDYVSVNISPRQLLDPGLATQVLAALEASSIQPGRLRLELTESTVLGRDQIIGDRIAFLRDLGVQVGLDEFGAGYSTLDYLKRFQIDFVKIDRSLIAGLGSDMRDTAIVRATVNLAHSLGISVVAVGVENDEQLDQVRSLGCNEAQGYHFAAPQPADELAIDLLARLPLS